MTKGKSLTLKYFLTARGKVVLSDYREYMQFNLFRGKLSRVIRTLVILAVVLLSLYLLLLGLQLHNTTVILAAGVLLLCFCMFFYLIRRTVKQTCLKKKPFLYATHEVRCGGNGLIYSVLYDPAHNPQKLPDSQQDYLYEAFFRVYETGGFFYFYPDKKSAIILPKRNLPLEDLPRLRTLLQKELGKRFVRCV